MPRKFRSAAAKKKDSNHRAALHEQKKAHNKQLETLLEVVEETQEIITQQLEACKTPSTSNQTDNQSNTPTSSTSRKVIIQEDLRSSLGRRINLYQHGDLRETLKSRRPESAKHIRQVQEHSSSPRKDQTKPKRKRGD
jgi:hypothetical protein